MRKNDRMAFARTASREEENPLDCLIIGAGPAGLTAAIYLARFRLKIAIVDAGKSRAAMIPLAHIIMPDFPEAFPARNFWSGCASRR